MRRANPPPVTIDPIRCDGCAKCIESCPTDVLRMDPATNRAVVAFPADCHICYLCQDDCPQDAITVGNRGSNPRHASIYDLLATTTTVPELGLWSRFPARETRPRR